MLLKNLEALILSGRMRLEGVVAIYNNSSLLDDFLREKLSLCMMFFNVPTGLEPIGIGVFFI